MTEREAISMLIAMGYHKASSDGVTVLLRDLLSTLNGEGPDAVVDFWPSHINLWRIGEADRSCPDLGLPTLVIHKGQ